MNSFYSQLLDVLDKDQVLIDEPMKKHTTFRIGGNASYFLKPVDTAQLIQTIRLCKEHHMPYYIVGNGSNLLVSDTGYEGAVIELLGDWNHCSIQGDSMIAGAGTLLSKIAREALNHGLSGFEFAAGIPGTLGGALVMNAGAYGSEMKDVLIWAKVLTKEEEVIQVTAKELALGYRTSCVADAGYIVLEACIRLENGDPKAIRARMDELSAQRKLKQPLEYPSAGSTFKRPIGYFAAKLIDDAGLRGTTVGGAQVSEKHCGFVVNKGDATAKDVLLLCKEVSKQVKEQFHVDLEMEVKTLGEL